MQERASQNSANFVHFCLPLTQSRLHRMVGTAMNRPNPGATRTVYSKGLEGRHSLLARCHEARILPQMAFNFLLRRLWELCCPPHCIHFRLASFPVMLLFGVVRKMQRRHNSSWSSSRGRILASTRAVSRLSTRSLSSSVKLKSACSTGITKCGSKQRPAR